MSLIDAMERWGEREANKPVVIHHQHNEELDVKVIFHSRAPFYEVHVVREDGTESDRWLEFYDEAIACAKDWFANPSYAEVAR